MAIPATQLEKMIKTAFPTAVVEIKALVDDNDHFHVTIKAKEFEGKSRLQQHQMVYEALGATMKADLHALSIKTEVLKNNSD